MLAWKKEGNKSRNNKNKRLSKYLEENNSINCDSVSSDVFCMGFKPVLITPDLKKVVFLSFLACQHEISHVVNINDA